MTKQVFISYSSNDLHTAERVCTLLEAGSIGCWIASRDVLPGTIYAEEIINAIENTDAIVLICSRYTSDSVHVRSEIEHAFSRKKIIFPVRMEDVELGKALEYFLSSSHWLAAWNTPLEECVNRLVESMRTMLAGEDLPAGEPAASRVEESIGVEEPDGGADLEEPEAGEASENRTAHPNNLPAQTTLLIGREKELEKVLAFFKEENERLLTLTGPGGVGKSRLGLQAAAEAIDIFEHGVYFVELAALSNPKHVLQALARTLGVVEPLGDARPLIELLQDYLSPKHLLLLMDNFEQALGAAQLVVELLAACPGLKMLVTSREPLHVRGEKELAVPPLDLPDKDRGHSVERLAQYGAVRLFIDRAVALRGDFAVTKANAPAVSEICVRLDGLPLAIELAAARIKILPPQKLLEKLANRLNVLKGGPRDLPARQRTLRGAIDWSHDLLDAEQKMLFRRLSVFAGGCTFEAAEAVCAPEQEGISLDLLDGLGSLVDKSLVTGQELAGEPRFQMLETISEYAGERLAESGEAELIKQRMANLMVELAEEAEPQLYGADQKQWFARLEAEHENIRAALLWLLNSKNAEQGLRLAGALGWFWYRRGRFKEGQDWLELVLAPSSESERPDLKAKAFYFLAHFKYLCAELSAAMDCFQQSHELYVSAGDTKGVALALQRLASCRLWLGHEPSTALAMADDSVRLARESGDAWTLANCLRRAYAIYQRKDQDISISQKALEEAIELARETGDPYCLCSTIHGMAELYRFRAEYEEAEPWFLKSLQLAREMDDTYMIFHNLEQLADAYIARKKPDMAKQCLAEAIRLAAGGGAKANVSAYLKSLGVVALHEDQQRRAVRLVAAAVAVNPSSDRVEAGFRESLEGLDMQEEKFAMEWRAGRALTQEQAVSYALEQTEE